MARISYVSLGCPKALVDSERILTTLRAEGYELSREHAGADLVIVNTCGFLDSAQAESLEAIGSALAENGKVVVTGCMGAEPEKITAKFPNVFAVTGPGEISAIVVPAGTPGLIVEPPYRKMGWHASDTHGLSFDGCRVHADHLLGERGQGFKNFLAILDDGRVAIAALAVGVAQACLEQSVAYANQRQAFGGPIGRYQAVAFKCADMAVGVENARNLTYKAAWLKDQGRPFKAAAAMAKLYATELAVTASREATQIFGGYGFIDETPVSRFYRDAKVLEIGEGTSEVQRLVLSRELGLPVER